MTHKLTAEFKREAVRIALTSGFPRQQVAADPGVGHSTLNKWVKAPGDAATVPGKEAEPVRDVERLRRELKTVMEEREVLKKATAFFAGQKR